MKTAFVRLFAWRQRHRRRRSTLHCRAALHPYHVASLFVHPPFQAWPACSLSSTSFRIAVRASIVPGMICMQSFVDVLSHECPYIAKEDMHIPAWLQLQTMASTMCNKFDEDGFPCHDGARPQQERDLATSAKMTAKAAKSNATARAITTQGVLDLFVEWTMGPQGWQPQSQQARSSAIMAVAKTNTATANFTIT